jgi:hypothetical protein
MDYVLEYRKMRKLRREGVEALRLYHFGDSLHSAILDIRVVMAMAMAIHVDVSILPAMFSFAT